MFPSSMGKKISNYKFFLAFRLEFKDVDVFITDSNRCKTLKNVVLFFFSEMDGTQTNNDHLLDLWNDDDDQ